MSLTRVTRHDRHEVTVQINVDSGEHYAALYCKKCNELVQWLSKSDADQLIGFGLSVERIYGRRVKSKFRHRTT